MKVCSRCNQERQLDHFYKHTRTADGLRGECKTCCAEISRMWRLAHPERDKEVSRKWRTENRARATEIARLWREKNRDKSREYVRNFQRNNPLVIKKNAANRRAKQRNAYAGWGRELTELVVAEACDLRDKRELATGIKWHVDHVIPLRGKLVSGLHVWNNLQVIPAVVNVRKNNAFVPISLEY